jgi:UDP-2-acetamido-3-amino-2,3-dideoxy-glucuronate N-acetyltransferase
MSQPTPNPPPPGIAVIGSGYWGKNLVRNYHAIGALKLICDKNESTLAQFQPQYPGIETCSAITDVLNRDDIQGVVIATPAETHFPIAREALLSGKHVYVEKPLVLDEAEGEDLISLADQKQRILMVGHLLQYHPCFIKLKEIALSGELGRINYIYSNRLNLGKIRREENILWSFAPHDISMILALAGEFPEQVTATGGYYLHKRIADVTTTHLEFPSGLQAHIFVSWLHPFKEQKLVVVGSAKMAVFDDTQAWEDKLLLYPHQISWKNNVPTPVKGEPERPVVPQAEPLRQECEHFLDCIATGKRPITDGEEGLRALRVLNAAQRALDDHTAAPQPPAAPKRPASSGGFFLHDTALVDEGCRIGKGAKIWHFSHVLKNSQIGENCNIGQNVVIGPDVTIGKDCKIQNNVGLFKGITLEDGVFCGPSMVFTNIRHPRAEIRKMDKLSTTLVKRGASLGANCTIVCGVTIGSYALIGAGAVVNRDVPDHALVVGNPARHIGWVSRHGERLEFSEDDPDEAVCPATGERYRKSGNRIEFIGMQEE